MRKHLALGAALIAAFVQPALAADSPLAGKWTYRSYVNNPALINDDPAKALAMIFAEATFTFQIPSDTTLMGAIDWPGGGLDLKGTIKSGYGSPIVDIIGTGRAGTDTADWEYDYHAELAYTWPHGVNQVPALVGTVIRAKPHDGGPAGVVASFIAVKQP